MTLFSIAAALMMLGQAGNMEDAAFLVLDCHGNVQVVRWPSTGVPDSAMWIGAVPQGAFAIAHTHPNWRPRPSKIDIVTARTTKMPVYVITRGQVWETAAGVAFRVQ